MKKNTMVLACALALGTALVVPDSITAQTSNPSPLAKLAHLIAVIRTETVATREELQATLNAPIRQEKGDLQPTIEPDTAEVKKTHAVADQTTARSSAMPEASKEYFAVWKVDVAGINDESRRAKAHQRMDAVLKNCNAVIKSSQDASEKFQPFLSNLDDVQTMLANDIAPGAVKVIQGVAEDANWTMKKVRSSILDAIDELGDMAKSL